MTSNFKTFILVCCTLICYESQSFYRSKKKGIPKKNESVQKQPEQPRLYIVLNGPKLLKKQLNKKNADSLFESLLPLTEAIPEKQSKFAVRVLLDETDKNKEWFLKSERGFLISTNQQEVAVFKINSLQLCFNNNDLYINDKKCQFTTFFIIPISGSIAFNKQQYNGCFCIERINNSVYLINQIELEQYIAAVLNCESWPGWPLEVNKAFAIASRSYLVAKILESRKLKRLYHIKNTNLHQTYKGTHENERLYKAIDETKGLILTYNKKPIEAMFDSCCGGIIPAHITGVDFNKAPYLARKTACNFCKSCKIFSWIVEYPLEVIETELRNAGYAIKQIKDLIITKKDKAGIVQEIAIKGLSNSLHLSGKQMYSLFSKLKSFCYSVEKRGKTIRFVGRGYGHHLGICQWGARRMIDAGMNFASILQFYYPGTTLMELKQMA